MGAINALGLPKGKVGSKSINEKLPTSGTPVCSVKAQGTLSMATKPTADDTLTIGDVTYTFVATPAATGDVAIGAAVANSQENLVTAINDGDDFNDIHPDVSVADFAANDMVITAREAGTPGNSITTTETFDAAGNVFDAATLGTTTAGVNGTEGEIGDMLIDDTYLYICVAKRLDGANWRRITLGNAY